jgi:SagB-type dehydrogenase family enzyme
VRPRWPGPAIDLRKLPEAPLSPVAKILRQRRSTRSFDNGRPITLTELARFLDGCARIVAHSDLEAGAEEGGHAPRPYPSGGAGYELELFLAVDKCEGLARGFYHYDADAHALTAIAVAADALEAQLAAGGRAMGAPPPQVLITIAARCGRISWKYSSIAYSLVLRDAGVLMQTLYLMASDLGLGGCAIGLSNIERFAKMTGLAFHVEGPVGQFALGRATAAPG